MRRLSRNEKFVLLLALIGSATGLVGLFFGTQPILFASIIVLIFLLIVSVILVLLRLDRMGKQQQKARQEIYQVLYWLHGSDKRTEQQARKTRDLVRQNIEQVRTLINRRTQSSNGKAGKPVNTTLAKGELARVDNLAEAERLRFNKLMAILDSQWEVLAEINEDVAGALLKYNDPNDASF